jgi:hypothetical protein
VQAVEQRGTLRTPRPCIMPLASFCPIYASLDLPCCIQAHKTACGGCCAAACKKANRVRSGRVTCGSSSTSHSHTSNAFSKLLPKEAEVYVATRSPASAPLGGGLGGAGPCVGPHRCVSAPFFRNNDFLSFEGVSSV